MMPSIFLGVGETEVIKSPSTVEASEPKFQGKPSFREEMGKPMELDSIEPLRIDAHASTSCTELETFSEPQEWIGKTYMNSVSLGELHCTSRIPLPTELHLDAKIGLKDVVRLYKGHSESSRKKRIAVFRPLHSQRRFQKLRHYFLQHKSAGVVKLDQGKLYLLPGCTAVCISLELQKFYNDALIGFFSRYSNDGLVR